MHASLLANDRFFLYSDFHIMAEGIEEAKEPVGRETAQMTSGKSRYFGLIDLKNIGRLSLRETAGTNDGGDLPRQGRLGFRRLAAVFFYL